MLRTQMEVVLVGVVHNQKATDQVEQSCSVLLVSWSPERKPPESPSYSDSTSFSPERLGAWVYVRAALGFLPLMYLS